MTSSGLGLIFSIDVDGKPTIAFEGKNLREAHELSREEWLRADLGVQTAGGAPLANKASKIKARIARPEEIAAFERERAKQGRLTDDLELVHLVQVDASA